MDSFRSDNTEGYTQEVLASLNNEWNKKVEELNLSPETEEFEEQEKWFCDQVANRWRTDESNSL